MHMRRAPVAHANTRLATGVDLSFLHMRLGGLRAAVDVSRVWPAPFARHLLQAAAPSPQPPHSSTTRGAAASAAGSRSAGSSAQSPGVLRVALDTLRLEGPGGFFKVGLGAAAASVSLASLHCERVREMVWSP
jgi:hypothetical protein